MRNDWQYIDKWSKKIRAINYLGGKCELCGDNNIFHLIFHHINADKEYSISNLITYRWSKLISEVKKCKLLCENCHQELHYKERTKNIKDDSRRKDKLIYMEYKGVKCIKCGYNKSEASLTFHHKNNKKFDIGSLSERINNLIDIKTHIIEELDKCDIMCRNCHLEEHIDIERFNKVKKEIYYKVDNFKEIKQEISKDKVKELYENGLRQVDLAKYFNTSKGTISNIIKKIKGGNLAG